jgi:nucleoid-associated protein YgaU
MRWNALAMCLLAVVFVLGGCEANQQEPQVTSADDPATMYPTIESDYGTEPYEETRGDTLATQGSNPYEVTTAPITPATTSTGAMYHTVAKGDTLFSLARMYYNDQSKWKVIYEANREQIRDKNKIFVGQQLLIP